jgi:hypothetical protein
MSCSLSWYRRNEFGKREQIEFKLVREKAEWTIHRERYEPRETYEPDDEDWDTLIGNLERNLQRGNVYPADLASVKRLRERQ